MRIVVFGLAFIINALVHLLLGIAFGVVPGQVEVAVAATGLAMLAMCVPQLDRMMREGVQAVARV